eukprot:SAG11_NODE_338_length_10535_cov_8.199885_6_plen_36_part_00
MMMEPTNPRSAEDEPIHDDDEAEGSYIDQDSTFAG